MTNRKVLLPYKITLLSNLLVALRQLIRVLLPYKITLLSNNAVRTKHSAGFTTL